MNKKYLTKSNYSKSDILLRYVVKKKLACEVVGKLGGKGVGGVVGDRCELERNKLNAESGVLEMLICFENAELLC
jgi:predicted CopG family antitoxin